MTKSRQLYIHRYLLIQTSLPMASWSSTALLKHVTSATCALNKKATALRNQKKYSFENIFFVLTFKSIYKTVFNMLRFWLQLTSLIKTRILILNKSVKRLESSTQAKQLSSSSHRLILLLVIALTSLNTNKVRRWGHIWFFLLHFPTVEELAI